MTTASAARSFRVLKDVIGVCPVSAPTCRRLRYAVRLLLATTPRRRRTQSPQTRHPSRPHCERVIGDCRRNNCTQLERRPQFRYW